MRAVTSPYEYATRVHGFGANVTAVGSEHKKPLHTWKDFQVRPQHETDVRALPWAQATRIGMINGINGIRSIDIDGCTDRGIVRAILRALGLPEDYPWVEGSSGEEGFHIWVRCEDDLPAGAIPTNKDEPGVYVGLSKDGAFDHLELRWTHCQTIISSSDGSERWLYGRPECAPALVSAGAVLNAFYAIASPKERPPARETPRRRDAAHADDRQDLEDIRARFDMIAYAATKWPDAIVPEGDEVRVRGHGGLLIRERRGVWYRFTGEQGGDCFDLVGYALYGEQWNRTIRQQFRAALREAAAFAGVDLNEYRRTAPLQPNGAHPAGTAPASPPQSDDVAPTAEPTSPDTFVIERQLSESANALRLARHHGEDIRYCMTFGQWFLWDETGWRLDDTGGVIELVKDVAANIYREAADASAAYREDYAKWARRSHSLSVIKATAMLAQSIPSIAVRPDDLDADPWKFNVLTGTIDLKTGKHQSHDWTDLITKVAPVMYDATATCPTFLRFLERIIPNADTRRFLQRFAGYSLTGDTREDAMAILYGGGRNGKTTLVELLRDLLGDYGVQTPTETLMVKRDGAIPNDLAALKGARIVAASEGNEGQRLAEGTIKTLTGRDRIPARFLNHEWFTFPPTFKVWFSTNHKPVIRGTDIAIWQRIRLIPFTVRFYRADELTDDHLRQNTAARAAGELEPYPPMDRKLPDTLRAEMPGILNWALAGCRDWLENGLGTPAEVTQAVAAYRADMDTIGTWIADCCLEGPRMVATAKQLYASYAAWCEGNGERTGSQRALGKSLGERGYTSERMRDGVHWFGIGIVDVPQQGSFPRDESPDAPPDAPPREPFVKDVNLREPLNRVASCDRVNTAVPSNKVHEGSHPSHDEREEFEI